MSNDEAAKTSTDEDVGAVTIPSESSVPSSPYSLISRQIKETDLASPAVQRILLAEVDKLQREVARLEDVETQYHQVDKETAVLQEKIKSLTSHEVLYGFSLTVGSLIAGLSPLLSPAGYGLQTFGVGILLVLGAVLSRVIKWR